MKRFITLILMLCCITTIAQVPTFDELLSYRTNSIDQLEETLSEKGWKLIETNKATETTLATLKFNFEASSDSDKARMFLTLMISSKTTEKNRLSVQVNYLDDYQTLLTKIKRREFKIESSEITDNGMVKVYRGDDLTIKITATSIKDGQKTKTYYMFLICNNEDYDLNFK